MSEKEKGFDPRIHADLVSADEFRTALAKISTNIEWWEAICLARARKDAVTQEVRRLNGLLNIGAEAKLSQDLDLLLAQIRENTGALMSGVRAFVRTKPGIPQKGELLEIAMGFVAAWRKGREAAASWLGGAREDAPKHLAQVKSLLAMAKFYMKALGRFADKPPEMEQAEFETGDIESESKPAASIIGTPPKPEFSSAPPASSGRRIASAPETVAEFSTVEEPAPPESPSAAPPMPDFSKSKKDAASAPRQRIKSAPIPKVSADAPAPRISAAPVSVPKKPAPAAAPAPPPAPKAPPKAAPKAPPPAPTRTVAPADLPKGVDADVLDDVRRVEQCRQIFATTHQQIEVWEVFCLVMLDRDKTKTSVEGLLAAQSNGGGPEFLDGAMALFQELLSMRAKYGKLAKQVREYIGTLQVGTFGKETMEMALGFIMASSRGRDRVQQWIDAPDSFRAEAAGRLEDIISRTMNYQTALRLFS